MKPNIFYKLLIPPLVGMSFSIVGAVVTVYNLNQVRTNLSVLHSTAYETKVLVATTDSMMLIQDDLNDGRIGTDLDLDTLISQIENAREELFFIEFADSRMKDRITKISEQLNTLEEYLAKPTLSPKEIDKFSKLIVRVNRDIGFTLKLATESSAQAYENDLSKLELVIMLTMLCALATLFGTWYVADKSAKLIARDVSIAKSWITKIATGILTNDPEEFTTSEFTDVRVLLVNLQETLASTLENINLDIKRVEEESDKLQKSTLVLNSSVTDQSGSLERIDALTASLLKVVTDLNDHIKEDQPATPVTAEDIVIISSQLSGLRDMISSHVDLLRQQARQDQAEASQILETARQLDLIAVNISKTVSLFHLPS